MGGRRGIGSRQAGKHWGGCYLDTIHAHTFSESTRGVRIRSSSLDIIVDGKWRRSNSSFSTVVNFSELSSDPLQLCIRIAVHSARQVTVLKGGEIGGWIGAGYKWNWDATVLYGHLATILWSRSTSKRNIAKKTGGGGVLRKVMCGVAPIWTCNCQDRHYSDSWDTILIAMLAGSAIWSKG